MKYKIILSAILLFSSCVKESTTSYEAHIINGTLHSVEIHFYKMGIVLSTDTIRLAPNQSIQIAEGWRRGIGDGKTFSSEYGGGPNDSNIVFFDNAYFVTHYANQPSATSKTYLPFSSLRNIANPL